MIGIFIFGGLIGLVIGFIIGTAIGFAGEDRAIREVEAAQRLAERAVDELEATRVVVRNLNARWAAARGAGESANRRDGDGGGE